MPRIKVATVLAAAIFMVSVLALSACGEEKTTAPPRDDEKPEGTRTYNTSPESTGQLLRDASRTIDERISAGQGVHFTMDSYTTVPGTSLTTHGEGDMVFPDRVKMTTKTLISGQTVETEVIALAGVVYTRSPGGMWKSSGGGAAPPDPQSTKSYMDFARSSRHFGQGTLKDGRKTYHVQVDVDTALAAEEAKKHTDDPATLQAIETTKNSTVTVDLWIGNEDLLVYQERVEVSNPATGLTSETTYYFSDWGRAVEITRPCEAC